MLSANRLSISLALVLFLTMGIAGAGLSTCAQDRTAGLDSVLMVLHRDSLFTGVILIGQHGEVLYTRSIGHYRGQLLTPRTPLPLASVTKPLLAAAVLSIIEDGLLELDAPIDRYLSNWPYPEITIRHLLNQSSGLHYLTTINVYADTTLPVTNADVLTLINRHQPELAFEPGTAFAYDNANYVTLAMVIEAVTEHSFAEVMRDRVFEPAAMDSARIETEDERGAGWLQWIGGGGIVASAHDLLAFDDAFFGGKLLDSSTVHAALTPPIFPDSASRRYGFGWFVTDDPWPMVGHFGDGGAAKTGLWHRQDEETTFIILMPGDAIQRTAILQAVMLLWSGQPYSLPKKRPVTEVPEHILARYVGVYDSAMGRLHITLNGGQLHLEPEGAGGSEPLIPASETVFYFGHQDLTWEFILNDSGTVTGLMLQGHPETLGQKVE